MAERVLANDKIEFAWNSEVDEILGDESVTAVRLRDTATGETRELAVEARVHRDRAQAQHRAVCDKIALEPSGYMKVEAGTTRTSVEGVFAAGDVADSVYRQAVTAAGTGCMAAIDAERWLAEQGLA